MFKYEQNTSHSSIIVKQVGLNFNSFIPSENLNENNPSFHFFQQKFILLLENYTNKIKQLDIYKELIEVSLSLLRIFLMLNSSFSKSD